MSRALRLAFLVPRRGPVLRRLAAVALLAALAGGGWIALRDSDLVRVRSVTVTGVSSSEGAEVRRALTAAARQMTTLRVRGADLRAAVREYSSVAGLSTQTDFPHGLAIEVTEREPVAEISAAGRHIPVGAGGRLMRGVRPQGPLPEVRTRRSTTGGRLSDRRALDAVAVVAAAPEILRRRVAKVWTGDRGLTLAVREGPQLYFGRAERLRAKWMAAARVLAEPAAAGAVYLDVRIPGRVAAGGLGSNPQLQPEESPTLDP